MSDKITASEAVLFSQECANCPSPFGLHLFMDNSCPDGDGYSDISHFEPTGNQVKILHAPTPTKEG